MSNGKVRTRSTGSTTGDQDQLHGFVTSVIAESVERAKEELKDSIKDDVKAEFVDEQREIKASIERTRNSVLAALALFATFFGFLTVNISIFARMQSLGQAAWFMVLMLCCLLCFLTVFFVFLFEKTRQLAAWGVPLAMLVLAVVLAGLTGFAFRVDGPMGSAPTNEAGKPDGS